MNRTAPQLTPLVPRGLTPELLPQVAAAELPQRFVAAVIDESGREVPITEAMIDAALRAFDRTFASDSTSVPASTPVAPVAAPTH